LCYNLLRMKTYNDLTPAGKLHRLRELGRPAALIFLRHEVPGA